MYSAGSSIMEKDWFVSNQFVQEVRSRSNSLRIGVLDPSIAVSAAQLVGDLSPHVANQQFPVLDTVSGFQGPRPRLSQLSPVLMESRSDPTPIILSDSSDGLDSKRWYKLMRVWVLPPPKGVSSLKNAAAEGSWPESLPIISAHE